MNYDQYPRESIEYVTPFITEHGAHATTHVEFSVVSQPLAQPTVRPGVWVPAEVVDEETRVLIRDRTPGFYRVWARVTDNPEIVVIDCGMFEIT